MKKHVQIERAQPEIRSRLLSHLWGKMIRELGTEEANHLWSVVGGPLWDRLSHQLSGLIP